MANLTPGFPGNKTVVEAIFNWAPLDPAMEGPLLAGALFLNNFMPYAKAHWAYEGTDCNCEDLSKALHATWVYLKTDKRPKHLPDPGMAATENIMAGTGYGLVTRPNLRVFAGPAHGNVHKMLSGALDGRALFPIHYVCRIGGRYFDPTFDRSTPIAQDCVENRVVRLGTGMNWTSLDHSLFYAFNPVAAPNFSNSYDEMAGTSYVSYEEWKTHTARGVFHTRSRDLEAVDNALLHFETDKPPNPVCFADVKTAFEHWITRNPKEAAARNGNGCVDNLESFLGVAVPVHF